MVYVLCHTGYLTVCSVNGCDTENLGDLRGVLTGKPGGKAGDHRFIVKCPPLQLAVFSWNLQRALPFVPIVISIL